MSIIRIENGEINGRDSHGLLLFEMTSCRILGLHNLRCLPWWNLMLGSMVIYQQEIRKPRIVLTEELKKSFLYQLNTPKTRNNIPCPQKTLSEQLQVSLKKILFQNKSQILTKDMKTLRMINWCLQVNIKIVLSMCHQKNLLSHHTNLLEPTNVIKQKNENCSKLFPLFIKKQVHDNIVIVIWQTRECFNIIDYVDEMNLTVDVIPSHHLTKSLQNVHLPHLMKVAKI